MDVEKPESVSADNEVEALLNLETPKPQNPVVTVRKSKKKKKGSGKRKEFEVQVIPATKGVTPLGEDPPIKRAAAYCRVSTDEDAQATSFDLQVKHYTEYIGAHENWALAGIYADEGISGTQVKHREQFQKMIEDCEAGRIDMIITKSISRFARNTVDCLTTIRKLKALKNPVEIYFEKERLSSLDEKMDMFLSMMASFAQEESRSISANIRWAIRNRMKNGTQKIPTSALLGYDTNEEGEMVEGENFEFCFDPGIDNYLDDNGDYEDGSDSDSIEVEIDSETNIEDIRFVFSSDGYNEPDEESVNFSDFETD